MSFSSSSKSFGNKTKAQIYENIEDVKKDYGNKFAKLVSIIHQKQYFLFKEYQHQGFMIHTNDDQFIVMEQCSDKYQVRHYKTQIDLQAEFPHINTYHFVNTQMNNIIDESIEYKNKYSKYSALSNNCQHYAQHLFNKFK